MPMPGPYFTSIPGTVLFNYKRIRRTSGGTKDGFGDATYTENQTSDFRGVFLFGRGHGTQKVTMAGHEVQFDAVLYTAATVAVGENDVILGPSSTSTAVSTRYHVGGIENGYLGGTVDHRVVYLQQEVRGA